MTAFLPKKKFRDSAAPIIKKDQTGLLWYVIFGVVIFSLTITFAVSSIKNIRLRNYALSITEEIGDIKKENAELSRQIQAMKNDPVYRESVIRKELKRGEVGELIIKKTP